jgi:hypothetical protein
MAHHGEFSSFDPAGPPTLTRVQLRRDGNRYQEPSVADHDLLDSDRFRRTVTSLQLDPVAEVLARWGWQN